MSQQWIRAVSLTVVTATEVLDLSAFRFTFFVSAFMQGQPKNVQLRLYNIDDTTAKTITGEGQSITLAAGYEGNISAIFTGTIVQIRLGRESGVDTYLDISGISGDQGHNYTVVNTSVGFGSTGFGRLGILAAAAGMQVGTVQVPANNAKLHRGRVYFGLARDHLDALAGTLGANWTYEDGVLNVISQNGYLPGDIPQLTSETGLVGYPEQTQYGISARCLLNPAIKKDMLVQIDNKSIQQYQVSTGNDYARDAITLPPLAADGIYKVLRVSHVGDTRGQEWYTDFVAYNRVDITGPVGAAIGLYTEPNPVSGRTLW